MLFRSVADASIFRKDLKNSCYYGKMVEGFSDDWVFEQEDGLISRVGKGGSDVFNMVGVSYFQKEDARILQEEIVKAYEKEENGGLFWDEVVDRNLGRLKLTVEEVLEGQIVEIDTVEEWERVNESI